MNGSPKLYDPILVAGVGRSGTSVVAGILWRLGIYMGSLFKPSDRENVTGYFEDAEFNDLYNAFGAGEISQESFVLRFEGLLCQRRALYRPWGVKNPKIADTVDLWLHYYPNARILWCTRPREECIASMRATEHAEAGMFDPEQVYDARIEALCQANQKTKVLCVDYPDLLRDPHAVITDIFQWIYADRIESAVASIKSREEIASMREKYEVAQAASVGDGACPGQ
jgi:hypothetical protein